MRNNQLVCLSSISPLNKENLASKQWPSPCGCWELQSFNVCLGMMDDTCTHWAIIPWCAIVVLSHFCVGANCMHSHAKTNEDNHLICVMYDRLSLDKLSDDLECLNTRATSEATCWFCSKESLHCVGKKRLTVVWCSSFEHLSLLFFRHVVNVRAKIKALFHHSALAMGIKFT